MVYREPAERPLEAEASTIEYGKFPPFWGGLWGVLMFFGLAVFFALMIVTKVTVRCARSGPGKVGRCQVERTLFFRRERTSFAIGSVSRVTWRPYKKLRFFSYDQGETELVVDGRPLRLLDGPELKAWSAFQQLEHFLKGAQTPGKLVVSAHPMKGSAEDDARYEHFFFLAIGAAMGLLGVVFLVLFLRSPRRALLTHTLRPHRLRRRTTRLCWPSTTESFVLDSVDEITVEEEPPNRGKEPKRPGHRIVLQLDNERVPLISDYLRGGRELHEVTAAKLRQLCELEDQEDLA